MPYGRPGPLFGVPLSAFLSALLSLNDPTMIFDIAYVIGVIYLLFIIIWMMSEEPTDTGADDV